MFLSVPSGLYFFLRALSAASLIMLENGFITGSANIDNLDKEAENFPIIKENKAYNLTRVLSNSFGFGGTNATLIFEKLVS